MRKYRVREDVGIECLGVYKREKWLHQNAHDERYRYVQAGGQSIGIHDGKCYTLKRHMEWSENPFCVCCKDGDEGSTDSRKHEGKKNQVCGGRHVQTERCYEYYERASD